MTKSDKIRHPKKRIFLAEYVQTASITLAAKAAEIDRRTHYEWKTADPQYAREFFKAQELAADVLEDEAVRRAHEGVERPVFQGGKEVGRVQDYSDTLLIFLLKGIRPEKYRERISAEHTGPNGTMLPPPKIEVVFLDPPARDSGQ